MKVTVKTAQKSLKMYTQSPAELAAQLNTQASAQNPKTKLLLGTATDGAAVTTREALVLRLSYIAEKMRTLEDLDESLSFIPLQHILLTGSTSQTRERLAHACLVIPLTAPLKSALGDDQLYSAALQLWLGQLRDHGVLKQIPRLRHDEWSQWLSMPATISQNSTVALYHDGPALDADSLRAAAQQNRLEAIIPTGIVESQATAQQHLKLHAPLDVIKSFASIQKDWLQDPDHRKACLLHLRAAENSSEILSKDVAAAIQLLAGDDHDIADELMAEYAKTRQTTSTSIGLRFFIQKNALDVAKSWLRVTPSGALKVDNKAFAKEFVRTHHVLYSPDAVDGVAYYYGGHWLFSKEAQHQIKLAINRELMDADVFHLTTQRECLETVATEAAATDLDDTPFTDAPRNLIEFKNVTYDIKEDRFIPNGAEHYQSRHLPYAIKTHGFKEPSLTLEWLNALVGHDEIARTTLVRFIGYSFVTGYAHQVMLFLVGKGGNGKSFLLRYIKQFFGQYTSALSWHDLTTPGDRFSLVQLADKYVNITGDIESVRTKAAQRLKIITGGDPIKVEKKGKDAFSVNISAKLLFAANQLPAMNDFTNGFIRRPRVIRMPLSLESTNPQQRTKAREFKQKYTPDKLAAEADDFVYYAIRSYVEANTNEADDLAVFPESPAMIEAKSRWIKTSDSVGSFIDKYLTFSSAIAAQKDGDVVKNIYHVYRTVTSDAGSQPVAQSRFVDRILDEFDGATKIRTKRRGIQATRLQGVVFNIDAIDVIVHEMGTNNEAWVKSTYRFAAWRAQDPVPKPLL